MQSFLFLVNLHLSPTPNPHAYLITVDRCHDERVGTEVGRQDLSVLDGFADGASTVEVRPSDAPVNNLISWSVYTLFCTLNGHGGTLSNRSI